MPVDIEISEKLSHPPLQENSLVMRKFMSAFAKLGTVQREALLFAVLEGMPYDAIARYTGVSVGTVKSRVSRGRDMLERLLLEGEDKRQSTGDREMAIRDSDKGASRTALY